MTSGLESLVTRVSRSRHASGSASGLDAETRGGTRASWDSDADEQQESVRWSRDYLRKEFKNKESENLFHKYQARLQHTFFQVALGLNILYNVASIAAYFNNKAPLDFPGPAVMRIAALLVFCPFLILTCMKEEWLRPCSSRTAAASIVCIAMIVAEHGGALLSLGGDRSTYSMERIRPTYYLIITNHVLLPFPSRIYACIATVVIITIEVALTYYTRSEITTCPSDSITRFTVADLLFYLLSAMVGYYMTFLLEIANRRAFMDHRRCVESTFKLDYEKDQQERLLNSCLPQHLTERVRHDILEVITRLSKHERIPARPFQQLYVEKHKNVSILYADIVNSMLLTAALDPRSLVQTLNELFARFDEHAEENNCLRIKLLGDCYYCVSGVPTYDPNHVTNCVKMGLGMIDIIRSVRAQRRLDVDMRIGVHTGMVLSGLLGLHKWQYDIWSNDSMLASQMEHEGVPGHVHVTQATLDLLPEADRQRLHIAERRVEALDMTTYLLSRKSPSLSSVIRSPVEQQQFVRRRAATISGRVQTPFDHLRRSTTATMNDRQRTILETGLSKYREMIKFVNLSMDKAIDKMPFNKRTQWFHPEGIQPFFLYFTRQKSCPATDDRINRSPSPWQMEKDFARQSDPLFRYYLICALALCLGMTLIKVLAPKMVFRFHIKLMHTLALVVIILALIFTFARNFKMSCVVRIIIWFLISVALLACALLDLYVDTDDRTSLAEKNASRELVKCGYTWYYTFDIILAMTCITLFIRINLWLKFLLYIGVIVEYLISCQSEYSAYKVLEELLEHSEYLRWKFLGYDPQVGYLYYIIVVALLLHLVDRQIEYIFRLDFQWNTRLESERKEVATMGEINRILLENILPMHVAQRYLWGSAASGEEIYHESYESVAVMFASIPNFNLFYCENHLNEEGLKCIQLLNEIICDFDQLLAIPTFSRVEKIKTIGSSYMAAAGIRPGRASIESNRSTEEVVGNVICIVLFATALMETLERINKDALQDFALRVGIGVGPVIGGVVGATKPQYDIWGDTVNVSSRMESTGIAGRIQVTRPVARILNGTGGMFQAESRGKIFVKGKGDLDTYLIKTIFDSYDNQSTEHF